MKQLDSEGRTITKTASGIARVWFHGESSLELRLPFQLSVACLTFPVLQAMENWEGSLSSKLVGEGKASTPRWLDIARPSGEDK